MAYIVWTDVLEDQLLWHIRWEKSTLVTFCGETPGIRVSDPINASAIDKCLKCSDLVVFQVIKFVSWGDYELARNYRLAPRQRGQ